MLVENNLFLDLLYTILWLDFSLSVTARTACLTAVPAVLTRGAQVSRRSPPAAPAAPPSKWSQPYSAAHRPTPHPPRLVTLGQLEHAREVGVSE